MLRKKDKSELETRIKNLAPLVEASHARGLSVLVWTVDDAERMERLTAWGVDGIITNLPGVARSVVDD